MKKIVYILLLIAIASCAPAASPAASEPAAEKSHVMPAGEVMEHEAAVGVPSSSASVPNSNTSGQDLKEPTAAPASGDVKEFFVDAYQFAYEPSEIRVRKGDTVRIHLHTRDVGHSLNLRDLNINIMANPGADGVREFVADTAGQFAWRCTLPCGSGHRDMGGMLIVE